MKRLLAYVGAMTLASLAISPYTGVSPLTALTSGAVAGALLWVFDVLIVK